MQSVLPERVIDRIQGHGALLVAVGLFELGILSGVGVLAVAALAGAVRRAYADT